MPALTWSPHYSFNLRRKKAKLHKFPQLFVNDVQIVLSHFQYILRLVVFVYDLWLGKHGLHDTCIELFLLVELVHVLYVEEARKTQGSSGRIEDAFLEAREHEPAVLALEALNTVMLAVQPLCSQALSVNDGKSHGPVFHHHSVQLKSRGVMSYIALT